MAVKLIVAVGENGEIGRGNALPWKIKREMDHFVKQTEGHIVVMGKKTWESLGRRPLKNRTNYVLTRNNLLTNIDLGTNVIHSLNDINSIHENDKDIFIIGGESIYNQAIIANIVDEVILTKIKKSIPDADSFLHLPLSKMEVLHEAGSFIDHDKIDDIAVEFEITHYRVNK